VERETALAWVGSALRALASPGAALTVAGLEANFAMGDVAGAEREMRALRVASTYVRVGAVLWMAEQSVTEVGEEEARAVFPSGTPVPPAYAIFGDRVYLTPAYARFGPMCRTAMLIHECVHVVDPRSGAPEVHVSEWDEPRFSSLTADEQEHNPSAYASFAAQMHVRKESWPREARYGAGNPAL
jgi:hypothetical protein